MLQTAINQNDMSEVYALTEQLFIQPLETANPAGYPDGVKDYFAQVDWHYNLKLIGRKFTMAEIQIIQGANHELFNEAPVYRQKVMSRIVELFTHIN